MNMRNNSRCVEMFVLFSFAVTLGIPLGCVGPCLPDLQGLWGVDLKAASSLFLVLCIACLLGLTVTQLLLTTVNGYAVLMLVTVTRGISLALFPHAGCLTSGGAAMFVCGATLGISSVACIHQANLIWPTQAGPIHFVLTGVAIGSTLAPILEKPFLSDGAFTIMMTRQDGNVKHFPTGNFDAYGLDTSNVSSNNITSTEDQETHVVDYNSSSQKHIQWDRFSPAVNNTVTSDMSVGKSTKQYLTTRNISVTEDSFLNSSRRAHFVTYIGYPFTIFGLMAIPVTIGLLICYKRETSNPECDPYTSLDKPKSPTYSLGQKLFIVQLLVYSTLVLAVSACFSNLIASFGVESVLQLGLKSTSTMTSVFWLFYTVGRFLPSRLPASITSTHLISTCFGGIFVGTVILFLCIYYGMIPLWVSLFVFALFTGPLYTSTFTLAREYVSLSPGLITLLTSGSVLGLFMGPFLLGVLMHAYGPNMFVYAIAIVNFIHLLLFMSTAMCAKYHT